MLSAISDVNSESIEPSTARTIADLIILTRSESSNVGFCGVGNPVGILPNVGAIFSGNRNRNINVPATNASKDEGISRFILLGKKATISNEIAPIISAWPTGFCIISGKALKVEMVSPSGVAYPKMQEFAAQ